MSDVSEPTQQSQERAQQRSAAKDPAVEQEKMRVMGLWLDAVCEEVGVDRDLVETLRGPMLGLISDVAHGPSRPGAPMTALVVGLAAAQDAAAQDGGGADAQPSLERIAKLIELARTWEEPATGAQQEDAR